MNFEDTLENKAKIFLIALADGRKEIEVTKAALCRYKSFVPGDLFSRVDRDNNQVIEV